LILFQNVARSGGPEERFRTMPDGSFYIEEDSFPCTVRRIEPIPDTAAWAAAQRTVIDGLLRSHGVVLLRGFDIITPQDFEAVAARLVTELYGNYGDLPHEDAGKIYQSTPYPADQSIYFHHESSHLSKWPRRQFFCCVIPPGKGGATPIVDGRQVYSALPDDIRDCFAMQGIRYVRNFMQGFDVSWQEMLGTSDKAEAEERLDAGGATCEWLPNDELRAWQCAPAVIQHPDTREPVFFNQLLVHHIACLKDSLREALSLLFDEDESRFPRSASFGDGTPIPGMVVKSLLDLYNARAQRFTWERGDVLILDNMLVAHGRDPFEGDRKILVAMGDMVPRADFWPSPHK
jgi:alpha-ketoglutarate-dependent taurine dioxygenase